MTPAIFFTRIEIIASIAFLVWFVYGRWQQLITDVTRHELFKIRHRIFLMAADKKVSFTSPQYIELRETFNGLIRYSHTITLPRVAALYLMQKYEPPKRIRIAEILRQIEDVDVRHAFETEWRKAADFVALAIFLRSPALILVAVILTPILPLLSVIAILDRQNLKVRYKSVRNTVEHGLELEACRSLQPQPSVA